MSLSLTNQLTSNPLVRIPNRQNTTVFNTSDPFITANNAEVIASNNRRLHSIEKEIRDTKQKLKDVNAEKIQLINWRVNYLDGELNSRRAEKEQLKAKIIQGLPPTQLPPAVSVKAACIQIGKFLKLTTRVTVLQQEIDNLMKWNTHYQARLQKAKTHLRDDLKCLRRENKFLLQNNAYLKSQTKQ